MTERTFKPLPGKIERALLDHQRWLSSGGRFGKRFECDPDTQFVDCDLEGMDFSNAKLDTAYFKGGSARGARFVGADLAYSTFDSCDVEGADFTRADLAWVTFITNHDKANFEGAKLHHTAWNREEGKRNEALLRRWLMPGGDPTRGQSR